MVFLSLEPFIPSGSDFDGAQQFFMALGFTISWSAGDYVGFEKDGCKFILQRYDNKAFAENLMINVKIDNATAFHQKLTADGVAEKFGIRIGQPTQQPYGKEVNVIDKAGVCWHFVE